MPEPHYILMREVRIRYTNHRGETAVRRIEPFAITFDANEWHPERQWLLIAWDVDKQAKRTFAMARILDWGVPEEAPAAKEEQAS